MTMTREQIEELEKKMDRAVDDVNALVTRWTAEGFRQEIMCGAFLGWLSAFAANAPEVLLPALVEQLESMTAERRRAIAEEGPTVTVAHVRKRS